MKKFLVEGWVKGTVDVWEEIEAENSKEAIELALAHYYKNIDMTIEKHELTASDVYEVNL